METIKQLEHKGYTIRSNRYAQKNLGNGWYVGVDLKNNTIDAGHEYQLPARRLADDGITEHRCYDYTKTNHLGLSIKGVKVNKDYVRNEEAHKVPTHMLVGWAELLEYRLK